MTTLVELLNSQMHLFKGALLDSKDVCAQGIHAGGPGSGCQGENCGRPPGSGGGTSGFESKSRSEKLDAVIKVGHAMKEFDTLDNKLGNKVNKATTKEGMKTAIAVYETEMEKVLQTLKSTISRSGATPSQITKFADEIGKGSAVRMTDIELRLRPDYVKGRFASLK